MPSAVSATNHEARVSIETLPAARLSTADTVTAALCRRLRRPRQPRQVIASIARTQRAQAPPCPPSLAEEGRDGRSAGLARLVPVEHVPGGFALWQRRDAQEVGDRHAGLVVAHELLGVIGHADRVLGKGAAVEIAVQ